jgi:hypothetical protein
MPMRPIDGDMISTSRCQHARAVNLLLGKIGNVARAGQVDLAHLRPPDAAALEIGTLVLQLMKAVGKLGETEKYAAWTRKPAA